MSWFEFELQFTGSAARGGHFVAKEDNASRAAGPPLEIVFPYVSPDRCGPHRYRARMCVNRHVIEQVRHKKKYR